MRDGLFAETAPSCVASSAVGSPGEWRGHVILLYKLDAGWSLALGSLLPFESVFACGFLLPLSLWQVKQGLERDIEMFIKTGGS